MTDRAATPDRVPANAFGLMRADRLMQDARREVASTVLFRYGVTWCGYLLLSTAVRRDGMDYRELASVADVSIDTVPRQVDKLSAIGLVTRMPPERAGSDRIRVTVTEAGQRQLAAMHDEVDALADTLLRELDELLAVQWYVTDPAVRDSDREPGS